jgi:hypothetical protein
MTPGVSKSLTRSVRSRRGRGKVWLANTNNWRLALTLLQVGILLFVWTWMSKPLLNVHGLVREQGHLEGGAVDPGSFRP